MLNKWENTESKFGISSDILYAWYDLEGRGKLNLQTERQIDTDVPGKYIILSWQHKNVSKMINC